jgi:hypothetical protein
MNLYKSQVLILLSYPSGLHDRGQKPKDCFGSMYFQAWKRLFTRINLELNQDVNTARSGLRIPSGSVRRSAKTLYLKTQFG